MFLIYIQFRTIIHKSFNKFYKKLNYQIKMIKNLMK